MIKKILMIMAGLLSIQMCCSSCGGAVPAGTETDGTPTENTVTDIGSDTVTEAPEPSPYLIPDAAHVDLTAFSPELFKASFRTGQASVPELTENGVMFKADKQSRDPYVYFKMNSMYKAAGYPAREDGENFVPFTADEKKTVVLKVQAEWGGAFEMFYTTGKERTLDRIRIRRRFRIFRRPCDAVRRIRRVEGRKGMVRHVQRRIQIRLYELR